MAQLREGNIRFVTGDVTPRDWRAQLAASVEGVHPLAAVLTTTDSRVLLPLIFDAGVGDLVTVRTPGPVVDAAAVRALESAAVQQGVRTIVVLGHSDCVEVQEACTGSGTGPVAQALQEAVEATPDVDEAEGIQGTTFADAVGIEHVHRAVAAVREGSLSIRMAEAEGRVSLVGAYLDVPTGAIIWL